ncbi:MAG: hypothetical protein IPP43_00795 [Chitinophagaceae bacterium]|nr:hypothetical protein [Chitinophagaceae bacterium]
MKKFSFFALLLIASAISFSQPITNTTSITKTDYLQKSKNQNTTAWVLLVGGATFILAGDLIGNSKESTFGDAGTGVIMAGLGVLSMIGSVPLFIASGKNKRKAISMPLKINL